MKYVFANIKGIARRLARWALCLIGLHEFGGWNEQPRTGWNWTIWQRCRHCAVTRFVMSTGEVYEIKVIMNLEWYSKGATDRQRTRG